MCHMYLISTTLHHISFLSNQYSVKYRFPFQILRFSVKSSSVTQRSVSQENAFKKSKRPFVFVFFEQNTMGLNISFNLKTISGL